MNKGHEILSCPPVKDLYSKLYSEMAELAGLIRFQLAPGERFTLHLGHGELVVFAPRKQCETCGGLGTVTTEDRHG